MLDPLLSFSHHYSSLGIRIFCFHLITGLYFKHLHALCDRRTLDWEAVLVFLYKGPIWIDA